MRIIRDKIFKDFAFSFDGDIDGDRDLLLYNCKWSGRPLDASRKLVEAMIMARNYNRLDILNCTLEDIVEGDGISLRSTGSGSESTRIENTLLNRVAGNGVIAKVNNRHVSIWNNKLFDVGMAADGKRHGMYIIAPDSSIRGNLIVGTRGDGISMRSSGEVIDNRIYKPGKSSIRYFPDALPGESDILYIENNECYQSDNGFAAIELLYASMGKMVSQYRIRRNDVIGSALAFKAAPEYAGRYEYTPKVAS